jgi:hypothetical protein
VVIGNVAVALVVLPVLAMASSSSGSSNVYVQSEPVAVSGTTLNGRPVTNIYAYGVDGKPLTGVQLFDQEGKPIVAYVDPTYPGCPDPSCDEGGGYVSPDSKLETGESAKNVYPRKVVRMIYNEKGDLVPAEPNAQRLAQKPPFLQVPRVLDEAKKAD